MQDIHNVVEGSPDAGDARFLRQFIPNVRRVLRACRHDVSRSRVWLMGVVCCVVLSGCANIPHAQYTAAGAYTCPAAPPTAEVAHAPGVETHEQSGATTAPYTLHIIEFDDQGWPFPAGDTAKDTSPSFRIDCAINDIRLRVERGQKVLNFVYVHGWHHTAGPEDSDLLAFKKTLGEQAGRYPDRQVIGIYVGWEGESVAVPVVNYLTYFGRKNAAHHIAEGSVRELFSRIKGLRDYWNRPHNADHVKNTLCDRDEPDKRGPDCPIRTIMVGHSFGAWILYASTAPYVMETLAAGADIPAQPLRNAREGDVRTQEKGPKTDRERGIADLILLINPAFEATRYNAVFNAARSYRKSRYEPPLLVSITSGADQVTRIAFPAVRVLNTLLQSPADTPLESRSMIATHGHIERYRSHELKLGTPWSEGKSFDPCMGGPADRVDALRRQYVGNLKKLVNGEAPAEGVIREFCGDLRLIWIANPNIKPLSVVWNVHTDANVIPGHNEIRLRPMEYLLDQLIQDLSALPRFQLPETTNGMVATNAQP